MNHLVQAVKVITKEVVAVVPIAIVTVLNKYVLLLKGGRGEKKGGEGRRGNLSNFMKISGHSDDQVYVRISKKVIN